MKNKKINLTTLPNTTLSNKTGSWRVSQPITDYNTCIGCSLCAKICPEGCIAMIAKPGTTNKKQPRTDYDYCKGCALCAHECPVKAIKMVDDY
jgi:2-oxoacid:acceptor oxidoreductase delta subunit (pyruvate/2-ketoisovalerate family)